MARRSWPWTKKSSCDKIAPVPTSTRSSLARTNESQNPKLLKKHLQIPEKPTLSLKECEQCKYLTERLSAVLNDFSAMEYTIQQHKEAAEDAISGWQKSQEEEASLRKRLDESATHRLEIGIRASQLDEAVQKLESELTMLRKEQEEKIQNVILNNDNTWNTVRLEFEARLSNTSHQLLMVQEERDDVLKAFRDSTKALSELHHSNSLTEAEAKMLEAKVEAVVRENSGLKFELQGINNLLEQYNEERVSNFKKLDAANRRQLESQKQQEKLLSECQKLRVSLRRKSASSSQPLFWRLELESLRKDIVEWKKWYSIANAESSTAELPEVISSPRSTKFGFSLSDRLSYMEKEGQMLKEAMTQRNGQLQDVTLMHARTPSCSSQAEEFLDVAQLLQGRSFESSPISHKMSSSLDSLSDKTCNVDQTYLAEAWSAALVTELAPLNKENTATSYGESSTGESHIHLMGDFVEMERLLSKIASPKSSPKSSPHEIFVHAGTNGFSSQNMMA